MSVTKIVRLHQCMHLMSTKNFLWCLLNERIFYSYTRHNIDLQSFLQVIEYLLNPHIDIFLIWLLKFNAMNNGSNFFASIVFKSSFPIFVLIFFINLTNAEGSNFFLGKKLWKMHILSYNKHDDMINKTCCVCNKTRNMTKMLRILQFPSNFVQLNIQII